MVSPVKRLCSLAITVCVMAILMTPPAQARVTPFGEQVNRAIDAGLEWLRRNQLPSGAWSGWATGLCANTFLEQRSSADWAAEAKGWSGLSQDDKTRVHKALKYLINVQKNSGNYSYGTGAMAMLLANYLATGGPDQVPGAQMTANEALRRCVRLLQDSQERGGAW